MCVCVCVWIPGRTRWGKKPTLKRKWGGAGNWKPAPLPFLLRCDKRASQVELIGLQVKN